jgi:hypothetical protein
MGQGFCVFFSRNFKKENFEFNIPSPGCMGKWRRPFWVSQPVVVALLGREILDISVNTPASKHVLETYRNAIIAAVGGRGPDRQNAGGPLTTIRFNKDAHMRARYTPDQPVCGRGGRARETRLVERRRRVEKSAIRTPLPPRMLRFQQQVITVVAALPEKVPP